MSADQSSYWPGPDLSTLSSSLYILLGPPIPKFCFFSDFPLHSCFPSPIYHSLAPCFFYSAVSCHSRLLSQLLHVLSVGLLPGSPCRRRTGKEIGLEDRACALVSESRLYTWMFSPLAPMRHSLPVGGSWRPLQGVFKIKRMGCCTSRGSCGCANLGDGGTWLAGAHSVAVSLLSLQDCDVPVLAAV